MSYLLIEASTQEFSSSPKCQFHLKHVPYLYELYGCAVVCAPMAVEHALRKWVSPAQNVQDLTPEELDEI